MKNKHFKKILRKMRHITDADKIVKHAGLSLAAGALVGLLAALLRAAF